MDTDERHLVDGDHIIVLPGGGYSRISDGENLPVVEWLQGLGIASSSFAYPIQTHHPAVLDAVRGEVRRVRSEGARRVGLIGFSAGGHAAGHAALAPGAKVDERVDIAILAYPVVSMQLATHGGSQFNLLGPDPSPTLREATSLDRLVHAEAPPFFIWHTAEDASVPVEHAYLLGHALGAAGVPHSLHVFPHGRHGLALAIGSGEAEQWTRLCAKWLRARGWLSG